MNLEVGTQLGEYRILGRIGKGAYGVVFEAEHSITRRIDAVKLMHDAGPSASDEEQRFLREIQAQASLQHPNIATVYGAFRTPWGLALAMELVKGKSLRTILQAGPLPPPIAIGYMLAVLDGLSSAERVGIVHRDIKPDNILITEDGIVKLTDFGLAQVANSARITSSGENLGTPCYMAPEQVIGSVPVDGRTDVYSTGVVLYEAVTGRPPFLGSNGFAVMMAQQSTKPVPPIEIQPSIGDGLNGVILKALKKVPDHRFQSAAEFRAALEQVAMPAGAAAFARPKARPSRAAMVAVGAGATLAMCGFGAWAGHFTAHRGDAINPLKIVVEPPVPVQRVELPPPAAPIALPETLPAAPVVSQDHPHDVAPRPIRKRRPARNVSKAAKSTSRPAVALVPAANSHPVEENPVRRRGPAAEPAQAPPVSAAATPAEKPPRVEEPSQQAQSTVEPAQPKRGNIFRRAFGKVFGRRAPTGQAAAPKAGSEIKP